MSDLFKQMIAIVLQNGLSGVGLIVFAFACRRLFQLYCDVQEKRIAENAANRTALIENTNALTKLADTMLKT